MQGHIVGQRRPRSSSSRFYVVDFGLKSEVPFTAKEIPGKSAIGDEVSMPLVALEDDFNEPVFDQERRSELSNVQAQRYELLTKVATEDARVLHGRFVNFKRVGASAKVLGTDAFVPRYHVVALDRPLLGSFAPFYVLSLSSEKRTGDLPGLDINPVVSSYGGFLFCLANLVGIDSAWERSGGGSSREKLAYLRLLTRLLYQKNSAVRRIFPKGSHMKEGENFKRRKWVTRRVESTDGDTAWLNDLRKESWSSSGSSRDRDQSSSWKGKPQSGRRKE